MQAKNLNLSIRKVCFNLEALKSNLDEINQASVTENFAFGIERSEIGNNLFGLFRLSAFRCRNRNEWCLNHFLIYTRRKCQSMLRRGKWNIHFWRKLKLHTEIIRKK